MKPTKNGSVVCEEDVLCSCGHTYGSHFAGASGEACACCMCFGFKKTPPRKAAKRKPTKLSKAFDHWKRLEIMRECKRLGLVVLNKEQAKHIHELIELFPLNRCAGCVPIEKSICSQLRDIDGVGR